MLYIDSKLHMQLEDFWNFSIKYRFYPTSQYFEEFYYAYIHIFWLLISGKTFLMKEKAIRLASAGEKVLFIIECKTEVKTLLHYKLDDYFKNAGYSGNITVVNSTSFVSSFLIVSDHLSEYYVLIDVACFSPIIKRRVKKMSRPFLQKK